MLVRTSTLKAVIKPFNKPIVDTGTMEAVELKLRRARMQQKAIRRYYHSKLRG